MGSPSKLNFYDISCQQITSGLTPGNLSKISVADKESKIVSAIIEARNNIDRSQ